MENIEMNNLVEEKKKNTPKKAPAKKTAVKTKIDPKTGTLKVVEKKAPSKKETTKKTTTKKSTTSKSTTRTSTAKKKTTVTKEQPVVVTTPEEVTVSPKVVSKLPTEKKVVETESSKTKEITSKAEEVTPKKRGRKPSENPLPRLSAKELTIEPPKRKKVEPKKAEKSQPKEPEVIVRPTPKKTKVLNKEEKVLYKKLEEAFLYVANLTTVVEERTMDTKQITDLTIGELHVIEMVDKYNNKPMSLIANKLKVTVGSLTICINRLVQKGYLLRIRHEEDHRIILISITPKGKKVLKVHDKFHDDILGLVLEGVTLQQAMKVMTQFAMVLENYYDPKPIAKVIGKKGSKK